MSTLAQGPVTTTEEPLPAAFEALKQAVTRIVAQGRVPRASSVKPAIRTLLTTFNEAQLGFATFSDFLREAEARGVVQLSGSGRLLEVGLAGEVPPVAVADGPQRRGGSERIRSDLWDVFVDWKPGTVRVYDRAIDRALKFPQIAPASAEDVDVAAARVGYRSDTRRFVPIDPIDASTTQGWMTEFTATLDKGPAEEALERALEQARPIQTFTRTARQVGISDGWAHFRVHKVAEVIQRWAEKNDLEVDPFQLKPTHQRRTNRAEQSVARAEPIPNTQLALLRARVHRAVDAMSYGELLRLSIPLEHVLDA